MLWLTIQGLLARKRRLFTTTLAVTLGVAFMSGTLVLTDTIGKTFDDLFGSALANTDVQVRQVAAFEGVPGADTSDQRGRVDASLIPVLRNVEGVAVAEGDIFGYARLLGSDGKPIGNPEMGAPTIGAPWSDTELNPFRLVAGQAPRADDEVVIDRKSANDGKLAVGDTTTVLVQAGPQQVRIAGIAKYGGQPRRRVLHPLPAGGGAAPPHQPRQVRRHLPGRRARRLPDRAGRPGAADPSSRNRGGDWGGRHRGEPERHA
jgi:putative ABC transport system permease protein